ncbi:MAG: stage IV sporulation protein A [Lachnospiraceae bacterium]|nr:stage IV sporulation protein A [Lachnospiraceae bacterium]
MDNFQLYKDIGTRTKGELYLGVVGPVRSGKSTFIKRFMDVCVVPNMADDYSKTLAVDELPQSAAGKTITTTEPKFVPKEAAVISLGEDTQVKVRLIDCVGYMVDGASGHMENDAERMVKTPWFEEEIPFTQAAEVGTRKVIYDHSTIGIVVTTDGSFTDIPAENYIPATERTILECKQLKKPFVVIVNTERPQSAEAKELADSLCEKHGVTAIPMNLAQLKKEDMETLLSRILLEFPISRIEFYMQGFVEMLPATHPLKQELTGQLREQMGQYRCMRDLTENPITLESKYIKKMKTDAVNMADGSVRIDLTITDECYYELLSDLLGEEITSEYQFFGKLKELSKIAREYEGVLPAITLVRQKGYGVMKPKRDEITLGKPEVIKHGNKFGVKMKAESPSVHLIRANIETEIAPIVGTKEQAEDLIRYIEDADNEEGSIWETNIFGKSIEQLVEDGIQSKLSMIGDESQIKLQDSMQKIVNDTTGGLVCIII